MPLRVFVAGAAGVIGRALLPKLGSAGHHVTALVHGSDIDDVAGLADSVRSGDLFDSEGLLSALRDAAPDVVVHQASGFRHGDYAAGLRRTADLRDIGTRNLVEGAVAVGARRIVAQSAASVYLPYGDNVLDEDAPLWTDAPGRWGEAVRSVDALESAILQCPDIEGIALRYGSLYGPDTWYGPAGDVHRRVRDSALPLVERGCGITSFTHVDDAAGAVLEVLTRGDQGAYNVVDNEPAESWEWLPAYARMIGGPEPLSLTLEQATQQLDWFTVHQLTEQRGATNFRFRETVGWRPAWPSWREGFASMFDLWPA